MTEQPEVKHGLLGPGVFGSGVDLSALDEDTAYRLGALVGQMIQSAVEADRKQRAGVERREFAQAHRDDLIVPDSGVAIEPMSFATTSKLFTWDWKEDAPLEGIGDVVKEFSKGRINFYWIETDSDMFAILISSGPLTKAEVKEIYRDQWGTD